MSQIIKIVLFLGFLHSNLLSSPTTLYEIEPNNTPTEATPFKGEIRLTGSIKKGDQDAFMWEIDEKDSQYIWNIELRGVPNAMTRIDVMKIILTPDGKEVEDYKKFFSFGTRTGNKPVHLDDLIFKKGKYLLALSSKSKETKNKTQNYQINITKGRKVYDTEQDGTKENAHSLSNSLYTYHFKDNHGWGYFNIDKEASRKLWIIKGVSMVGEQLKVQLFDKDEQIIVETVTNKFGKYKLEDLELDEGKYYLKYSSDTKGFKSAVRYYSSSRVKIDANEVEPNNELYESNTINYKKIIHGKVDKNGDYDFFKFTLPKRLEDKVFDITLKTEDKKLRFYLNNASHNELNKKNIDSNFTMRNLQLEVEKEYLLVLYGSQKDKEYSFKFSEFREHNSSLEVEPNDDKKNASSINVNQKIEGEFAGYEYDCFAFNIDTSNKLWNISVMGDKPNKLELFGAGNAPLLSINKERDSVFNINNLLLLSGNYKTCINGKNGKYSFLISEAKLSDLNISSLDEIEHEPNQDKRQTNELKFGQMIKGTLETGRNEDYFHFTLKNYEHIRLTATPPKDGDNRIKLISENLTQRSYPKVGEISVIEGVYPPGRYVVDLWTKRPSYGLYSLKLEQLNFFDSSDIEPNDKITFAQPLPKDFHIKGFTSIDDQDWIKFPNFMTKETNITISGDNLKRNIILYPNNKDNRLSLKWNEESKTYTSTLKTPQSSYFVIGSGIGLYDYNLSFTEYQPKPKKELKLSLNLNLENFAVATYNEFGQKVNFSVDIESLEDYDLNINSHLSDSSWHLDFNKSLTLKSSERKTANFTLIIPKNIDKTPVITTLKFSNKNGNFKTVSFTIEPKDNIKALNPYEDWGIPQSLLGGINVARLDYGAKRVIEHNETEVGYVPRIANGYHLLFDDIVHSDGFYIYSSRKIEDENVTIELTGEDAVEVMGVILYPFGRGHQKEQLKAFSISLSQDGKAYQTIYRGELGIAPKEQPFVFDKTYLAKYARLTLHSNQNNETIEAIGLGEWKVVAKQESLKKTKPFNIANPKLGGHVVKASKQLSSNWDNYILTAKDDIRSSSSLYKKDKELSWVIGFKNERVAKITEMLWREPKRSKKATYMKKVKIFVSTTTPNGSWREMETWEKEDSNQSSYKFKKPTWARYVKFVFPIEKKAYYALPEELQIMEEQPSHTYKSILGEWGDKNHRSFYEYQQQKDEAPLEIIMGNDTEDKAYQLESNQTIQGKVSVANHEEDWHSITVPEGQNHLTLNISGREGVDVTYELFDKNGTVVEPSQQRKESLHHQFIFDVQAGEYHLKVKQPPISVVFAWDNSGSVSPYHKEIFNSVNGYIQTIQEKIDAVNLICFNAKDKFILDDFSDKPNQIEQIFNNFDRDCSDSDAERPLRKSSERLKDRDGIKGVIIIGDAVGGRDIKLWKILEKVKPKVFSIRVQSQYQENEIYEGIMQSWSRVNNGTYTVVSNAEEMYQAINLASAILRRPVYYKLNIESSYVQPLGDGSLKVVQLKSKKQKVNKNFAIELILDASGSMLKRIKGKRRIAIARDVLKKAVKEIIPPKTQVALRVFGHKKADSCRTDLEMRLQPLNVKKTSRIISKINAKNLAKTPIADSLAKVASDLSKVKGKKVVILVTDGEETCDGDPAKEIQTLKDKGIDVRINIVGFAINDEKLKAQFAQWAELGNGTYFEANDKKSLDVAIKKALQIPFKVYKKDELIGSGIVGIDELKIKGGTYRVVVETSPEQVFEEVKVIGEQPTALELKDEK